MAAPFQASVEDEQRSATPPTNTANAGSAPTAPAAPANLLNLCFRDQHGAEVHFKLKPSTKMKKAMEAFAAKMQVEARTLRYFAEGIRIADDHTPESVSYIPSFLWVHGG